MIKKWRFIDTGVATARYNMAVDEALLSNFKEGDLPIFRLYGWESSLSFGRFSKPAKNLSLEKLQKQNLSFVRRITGGGILLHGGDISYSLILPRKNLKDIGVKESYSYLCQFLINFYEKLGLDAKFANELNLNISKSDICMCANESYDIIIDGKKIGGNAQRYTKNILFQHGSIPLTRDGVIFKDIFLDESVLDNLPSLDKMKKDIENQQLSSLLIEAFTQSYDVGLLSDTLSSSELLSTDELLKLKYSKKSWNIGGSVV
ncbi:MAG: biotin/lipoate A/B protein ligase family protein [Campylobacterota bacterium]|nr:biotin/lipoate A/B protein ligase family protein [Campylobacterota bacterium]